MERVQTAIDGCCASNAALVSPIDGHLILSAFHAQGAVLDAFYIPKDAMTLWFTHKDLDFFNLLYQNLLGVGNTIYLDHAFCLP